MSMTRLDIASLSVCVRLSSASWKRDRRWSSVAVISSALALTLVVEIVDIDAHRVGDLLGALAEALDQFAAIGLHGAVEFGEVRVIRLPSVAESRPIFSASSAPPCENISSKRLSRATSMS